MSDRLLLGGIEAGGAKFLCAVADRDRAVLLESRIATTTPAETLGAASAFFRDAQRAHGDLSALSIGSFSPLSLNPLASDHVGGPPCLIMNSFRSESKAMLQTSLANPPSQDSFKTIDR